MFCMLMLIKAHQLKYLKCPNRAVSFTQHGLLLLLLLQLQYYRTVIRNTVGGLTVPGSFEVLKYKVCNSNSDNILYVQLYVIRQLV